MATSPTIQRNGENIAICTVDLPYNNVAVNTQAEAVTSAVSRWKEWQGQFAGKFSLKEFLGGSGESAVFATELTESGQKAAIRLLASDKNADAQLARWNAAEKLAHPNLLRVYTSGKCEISGVPLLYAVEEFAEENLAQVLPQRALTHSETSEMLVPLLNALAFLHSKGYVHGGIRPAHVMAIGDRVKLPSDALSISGSDLRNTQAATAYDAPEFTKGRISPPADVWSLGVTLVEVLTQRLSEYRSEEAQVPKNLPEPFGDIARNCLQRSPQARWTIGQIQARLQGQRPITAIAQPAVKVAPISSVRTQAATSALSKQIVRWRYLPALATGFVVLALITGSIVWDSQSKPRQQATANQTVQSKGPVTETAKPSPGRALRQREGTTPVSPAKASREGIANGHGSVLHPVYPNVPRSAQNTIHGHVRVAVRLSVDAAGNVTGSSLESAGPSKYFDRLALASAREWKFAPPEINGHRVASQWLLRYAFGRRDTQIQPQQRRP